jgi:hypothetical protein
MTKKPTTLTEAKEIAAAEFRTKCEVMAVEIEMSWGRIWVDRMLNCTLENPHA